MIVSKMVKNIKCLDYISKGKTIIQENLHEIPFKENELLNYLNIIIWKKKKKDF